MCSGKARLATTLLKAAECLIQNEDLLKIAYKKISRNGYDKIER